MIKEVAKTEEQLEEEKFLKAVDRMERSFWRKVLETVLSLSLGIALVELVVFVIFWLLVLINQLF